MTTTSIVRAKAINHAYSRLARMHPDEYRELVRFYADPFRSANRYPGWRYRQAKIRLAARYPDELNPMLNEEYAQAGVPLKTLPPSETVA